MPEVDSILLASLRQAKKKRMFFAFIANGTEGKLLVDKQKIPAKEAAEAKKECGGGTIFYGRCQDEAGTMIFEVSKEPPAALAKQIKTTIKRETNLSLDVATRVAGDADETATESEPSAPQTSIPPTPAPPSAPSPDAVRFAARLKSLAPVVQKLEQLGSPLVQQAKKLIGEANASFRQADFIQANANLDRVENVLKQALQSRSSDPKANIDKVLADWQAAREKAVTQLKTLAAAIANAKYAESMPALVLVNSIIKNLTPRPASLQAVVELETYLQTDSVITDAEVPNGWGITVELRKPLLAALPPLKQALGA